MKTPTTFQELFDTVASHLLHQGKQAMVVDDHTGRPVCEYRTSSGLQCAIGCLMPDEHYDKMMEGMAASELSSVSDWFYDLVINLDAGGKSIETALDDLQDIHDEKAPATWPYHLQKYAKRFGLTYKGYL